MNQVQTREANRSEELFIQYVGASENSREPALQVPASCAETLYFSRSLLSAGQMPKRSRRSTIVCSLLIHTALLAAVILIPLWLTDTVNLEPYRRTLLVAPPPPAPPAPRPPAAPEQRLAPRRVFAAQAPLSAPRYIPREVAKVEEALQPPDIAAAGVEGGVPGGVSGGMVGGVFAGLLSGGAPAVPEETVPPPVEIPKTPLQVGGKVRPPRPIYQPTPVYPPLARQGRVEGEVVVSAIIDVEGNVVDMKVVSGPPLLYAAALDALARWRFEPTYLNGEPWPVSMRVTIQFRL